MSKLPNCEAVAAGLIAVARVMRAEAAQEPNPDPTSVMLFCTMTAFLDAADAALAAGQSAGG